MNDSYEASKPRARLIVWDFDGVINNAVEDGEFLWARNFERDLGYSLEVFEDVIFSGGFQDVLVGRQSLVELVERWASRVNYSGSIDDILNYWFFNDTKYDIRVVEIIEEIRKKGIKQVIATNTDPERSGYILEHISDLPGISELYSSGLFGVAKPDRRFFEKIQEKEQLKPSQILFIDDSEKNVSGARDFGWSAKLFNRSDIDELLGWITIGIDSD